MGSVIGAAVSLTQWSMVLTVVAVLLMFLSTHLPPYPVKVVGGSAESFKEIVRKTPLLQSCPRGPFDFSSSVQLLIFGFQMMWEEFRFDAQYNFIREEFETTLPGDSVAADMSPGVVAMMWLLGRKGQSPRVLPDDAPIVILCPGLNCYTASLPGTSVYGALLERPWRVAVFEKRGVGHHPSSVLTSPVFHLFGHPSDLHVAVVATQARYPNAPIHIAGVSSGNGLVGSYTAMYGSSAKSLRSVLMLVGGDDYNSAFAPQSPSWLTRMLFDNVLLETSKQRFLRKNWKLLEQKDAVALKAAAEATTLQSFYDITMRSFSGYADSQEAERRINAFTGDNNACFYTYPVPVLYVGIEDDPVAPGGPKLSWQHVIGACETSACALLPCGSHLGCYDSLRLTRWLDRLLVQWVDVFESQ